MSPHVLSSSFERVPVVHFLPFLVALLVSLFPFCLAQPGIEGAWFDVGHIKETKFPDVRVIVKSGAQFEIKGIDTNKDGAAGAPFTIPPNLEGKQLITIIKDNCLVGACSGTVNFKAVKGGGAPEKCPMKFDGKNEIEWAGGKNSWVRAVKQDGDWRAVVGPKGSVEVNDWLETGDTAQVAERLIVGLVEFDTSG